MAQEKQTFSLWGNDGFNCDDELATAPRVLGAAIGFGAALTNAVIEQVSGRDGGEHATVALLKKWPSAPLFGQGTPDIQYTLCAQAAIAPVTQSTFQETRQDGFFNLELSERIGFPARAESHIRLVAAHETYTQNKLLLTAIT